MEKAYQKTDLRKGFSATPSRPPPPFFFLLLKIAHIDLKERNLKKERRCNTRGGKAKKSLSEENCPLEALRVFFLL